MKMIKYMNSKSNQFANDQIIHHIAVSSQSPSSIGYQNFLNHGLTTQLNNNLLTNLNLNTLNTKSTNQLNNPFKQQIKKIDVDYKSTSEEVRYCASFF